MKKSERRRWRNISHDVAAVRFNWSRTATQHASTWPSASVSANDRGRLDKTTSSQDFPSVSLRRYLRLLFLSDLGGFSLYIFQIFRIFWLCSAVIWGGTELEEFCAAGVKKKQKHFRMFIIVCLRSYLFCFGPWNFMRLKTSDPVLFDTVFTLDSQRKRQTLNRLVTFVSVKLTSSDKSCIYIYI